MLAGPRQNYLTSDFFKLAMVNTMPLLTARE